MRKYLYNIIGLFLLGIFAISCDSAQQDVSPIVSPDDNPVATFISDFSGSTITEGDTITYSISLDKPHTTSLTFSVKVTGGTADESDIEVISGTIPAFHTETEVQIIISADNFPEESETIDLEIGLFSFAEMYVLNPSVVNPTPSFTIANYNAPNSLTISFGWEDDNDDYDVYIVDEGINNVFSQGATSSNPEALSLGNSAPDDTYYVEVDPYYLENPSTTLTFSIGHPDQTVEFFTATFDSSLLDEYEEGGIGYRIFKIVKSGSTYTCSSLL